MNKQNLYLIDGTSWLFRSYYSVREMYSPKGVPVNAVFGVCMMAQKFLKSYNPENVVVVFDSGLKTFRNDIYSEYKANRGLPPEDLKPQFDLVKEAMKAFGFLCIARNGYEADDLIASIACQYEREKYQVFILSNDKDLCQVVSAKIKLLDFKTGELMGPKEVFDKFGVQAKQMIDYQALIGDSIDNIPGIKGVGSKAGAFLLNTGIKLETIFKNPSQLENKSFRGVKSLIKKLEEGREAFELSKRLVTLDKDLKGSWGTKNSFYRGASKSKIGQFCEKCGFARLQQSVERNGYFR